MGTRGREGVPDCGVVSQSWDFNVCLEWEQRKVPPSPGRESGFSEATGNSVF